MGAALGALFCKAGHSPPSNTPRDRERPGYPLCPGVPELCGMKKTTFQFFQRTLIKNQGEKPPSGTSETAKQVDTSASNLC